MKKSLILLIFLLRIFSVEVSAQYAWKTLPNAPKSWRVEDIYFLTPQLGWAASPYYDYLYPNVWGRIYVTRDGGDNWEILKDSSKSFYEAIGFADSLNGWVGNLNDSNIILGMVTTADTVALYHTADGGKTWFPVLNIPAPQPKAINSISIVNDSIIYALGRDNGPAVVIKSIDKGKTWASKSMSSYATGLADGYFFNKDTGLVIGRNGKNGIILGTNDGGSTWTTRYQSSRKDSVLAWRIFFSSKTVGFVSLESFISDTTYFLKTIDGGKTWTEHLFSHTFYDQEGIGFINDSIGWIGGGDYTYKTLDGGKSWAIDKNFGKAVPPYTFSIVNPNYSINRFRAFGDTLMYACGNTVYKLNKTSTGINSEMRNIQSVIIFPNPATQSITIRLDERNGGLKGMSIFLYNLQGQQVQFYPNITDQEIIIPRNNLPAGMYFLKLQDKEGKIYTAKLMWE